MSMLKIDGNDSLFELFAPNCPPIANQSGVTSFLYYVLQYCYFFDHTDAKNQHKKILTDINNGNDVPARNSTHHIGGLCDGIKVKSDKNGNAPVVALIQDKTGYSVSKGKIAFFKLQDFTYLAECLAPIIFH